MNKLLEEVLDERANYPLGKRPGYPVFHSSRAPYRTSIADTDLERISAQAHTKWPEYMFKLNSNQSMVNVSIYNGEERIDTFKFSIRDYSNMDLVVDAEGVFKDYIEEFLELVSRVLD